MASTDIFAGLGDLLAREPDGTNNDGDNNAADDVGVAGDPYLRITGASYVTNASDGSLGAPFGGPLGPNGMVLPVAPTNPPPIPIPFQSSLVGDMPQAEAVSAAVMDLLPGNQEHPSSFAVNELFDFFGQALTHDVAEASTQTSDLPLLMDGLPFPFARTLGVVDGDGVRQQINEETSFLDLSFVYGNSQTREDLARDSLPGGQESAKLLLGADGLLPTIKEVGTDSGLTSLQVLQIFTEPGFAGLPDPTTNPDPTTFENLYYTGDNRANQQPPLIVLQTTWAREHNYQVDQLTPYATAQGWTQDQLFEAARAVTEAEWQNIVFNEYVPTLIGTQADALLSAYEAGHPGTIDPGIINEWTTVAFRFGHDQSSNDYTLLNADGSKVAVNDPSAADPFTLTLGTAFTLAAAAADVPGAGHSAADIDAWIRGLSAQFTQEIDGFVADGNREALFGGLGATVDLEAFDIQRGRDHGVWNYNALRAGLGLATYTTFNAFATANGYALDDPRIIALKGVYGDDISKLDSIVGGLLEKHYADSQLGETFTLLNAIQFDALKGDQFYFEDRLADNPELLASIKGTTFAEIMERNSGADHLNLDTFQVAKAWEGSDSSWKGDVHYGADDATYLKADLMIGGGGNDKLYGKDGSDTLYGDAGNDYLDGGKGDDFLRGGDGNDSLYGAVGNDNVAGEKGNDYIALDGGNDWADGGEGNDTINGGDGDDIALGKGGNDDLSGGKGADQLFGGDGNDHVSGDAGDDKVYGGAGNDTVSGDAGKDEVHGEGGNDKLDGGAGDDHLDGGAGNDELNGGAGVDRVEGGSGNDKLDGGANADTFVFKASFGNDRVSGFDANPAGGQDLIELSGFGINAANFASHVTIADVGADTLLTIDGNPDQTIRLLGIGNANTITVDDFRFV
jgi:Ca2+-binding RTX toxin-like protein